MICKNCGENLPDNARICDTCGAAVKRTSPVAAEESESSAPKKQDSAVLFFRKMFSTKKYRTLSILLSAMAIISLIDALVTAFEARWDDFLLRVVNLILYAMLAIPAWNLYLSSPFFDKSSKYIPSFKTFKVVTLVFVIAQGAVAVLIGILGLIVTSFNLSAFIYTLGVFAYIVVLIMIPSYMAHGFVDSMLRSAINDRIQLKQVGSLAGLQILFGIFSLLIFVTMLISSLVSLAHGEVSLFLSSILQIVTMVLYFSAYDWLRDVKKDLEWM